MKATNNGLMTHLSPSRSARRASEVSLDPELLEPPRRRTWKHFGWGDRALIVALLVAVIGGYALVVWG